MKRTEILRNNFKKKNLEKSKTTEYSQDVFRQNEWIGQMENFQVRQMFNEVVINNLDSISKYLFLI